MSAFGHFIECTGKALIQGLFLTVIMIITLHIEQGQILRMTMVLHNALCLGGCAILRICWSGENAEILLGMAYLACIYYRRNEVSLLGNCVRSWNVSWWP